MPDTTVLQVKNALKAIVGVAQSDSTIESVPLEISVDWVPGQPQSVPRRISAEVTFALPNDQRQMQLSLPL